MLPIVNYLIISTIAITTIACSPVDEITPKKYVGIIAAYSSNLKTEITKSLTAFPGKPVPQAGPLQLLPPPGLAPMRFDFGWVTGGGAIVIQSSKFNVIFIQEPIVEQSKVTWSCIVYPVEAKPKLCNSEFNNKINRSN